MKLRTFGSLIGLLGVTLAAPACGDDDDAVKRTDTDATDDDAGKPSKDTDESKETKSDKTKSAATDASDTTDDSTSTPTTDSSDEDAQAGDTSAEPGDEDAGPHTEPDAAQTEEDDAATQPPAPDCDPDAPIEYAPVEISSDTTWDCAHRYVLSQGQLTIVSGATLTIKPGTTILGQSGSGLVITNNGKIDATGQANAPIVFTSAKQPGTRQMGDWGGILLLGKAPINFAGGVAEAEGVPTTAGYAQFGGDDEAHDCGRISYTRIEFSGFQVSPDNELNALGVAGCGTATQLHHIQAHRGSDDGFEFWGGAPEVHHLVSSLNDDDLLDWTDGFSSHVQFVVLHNPVDNGVEGDNSEVDYTLSPRTLPQVSNMTLVGGSNVGILLRRGSWGKFYNSIIMGNANLAVDLRDDATLTGTTNDSLTIQNSIFWDNGDGNPFADDPAFDGDFDEESYFSEPGYANLFTVNPNLVDPTNPTAPDFTPADDTVLNGAIDVPDGFYDTTAKYIGAFEPGGEDWTAGWTAYPAN